MTQFFEYYGRYQGLRGRLGGLPSWARTVLFLVALPGIALVALSILALLVSILALLLLTVPVYRLLQVLTGQSVATQTASPENLANPEVFDPSPSAGRRHVDVKIVE